MSRPIIEVRNVSKCYRLGHIGFTSLRSEVERWWDRMRGRAAPTSDGEFWALRDVSFDIAPGEVTGIIGRNGAGKSTLLKILSEITEPTSGEIRIRGQVASLLEVGTGFHPELSGRENIYLNGATLGMKRAEIRRKFDEIVAFAEVEKFLDTPVKRYSSGMYVRLAFAVAAHLEPEILLVDEVLAVGDHAFQQKCLGKMQDVATREGRTVLFVSHNMAAVSQLCQHAVLLRKGVVAESGSASNVVRRYLAESVHAQSSWTLDSDVQVRGRVALLHGEVQSIDGRNLAVIPYSDPVVLQFEWQERDTHATWMSRVVIVDQNGHEVVVSRDTDAEMPRRSRPHSRLRARCQIPGRVLKPGTYAVHVSAHELWGDAPVQTYEERSPVLSFTVSEQGFHGRELAGLVAPPVDWRFESQDERG